MYQTIVLPAGTAPGLIHSMNSLTEFFMNAEEHGRDVTIEVAFARENLHGVTTGVLSVQMKAEDRPYEYEGEE